MMPAIVNIQTLEQVSPRGLVQVIQPWPCARSVELGPLQTRGICDFKSALAAVAKTLETTVREVKVLKVVTVRPVCQEEARVNRVDIPHDLRPELVILQITQKR